MDNGCRDEGLSIIIPTYNFTCVNLVSELCRQCRECLKEGHYEILVYDDASDDLDSLRANSDINSLPGCSFRRQSHNKGRSRLRNQLIRDSRFRYILTIDSDAEVGSPTFIRRYLEAIPHSDIVIGGICTSERYRRDDNLLRFRYETAAHRSIRQPDCCNRHPYRHFTAFNAMFHARVFSKVMFCESLTDYGFEDTLLGAQLEKAGYKAVHICNPLIHTGIDSTDSFLQKTEESLHNLSTIHSLTGSHSSLCRWYDRLRRCRLHRLMAAWHSWAARWERINLYGKHPSLMVFQLYKLGRYAQIMEENKKRLHR